MQKLTRRYKQKVWITEKTIHDAIQNNWVRSLVTLVALKNVYKKPIFYNFTYRNLSIKTNIPTSTIQRHIKTLIQKGLITIENNHLCVIGSTSLRKSLKSPLIAVECDDNRKHQLTKIQFTRILKNFRQQHYISHLKADIINLQKPDYISLEKVKTTKAKQKKYISKSNEKLKTEYVMSNMKFATSINRRSKNTGIRLQKQLNELHLISSYKHIVKVSNQVLDRRSFFEMDFKYNCFLGKDGIVRQRLANIIRLCK